MTLFVIYHFLQIIANYESLDNIADLLQYHLSTDLQYILVFFCILSTIVGGFLLYLDTKKQCPSCTTTEALLFCMNDSLDINT